MAIREKPAFEQGMARLRERHGSARSTDRSLRFVHVAHAASADGREDLIRTESDSARTGAGSDCSVMQGRSGQKTTGWSVFELPKIKIGLDLLISYYSILCDVRAGLVRDSGGPLH